MKQLWRMDFEAKKIFSNLVQLVILSIIVMSKLNRFLRLILGNLDNIYLFEVNNKKRGWWQIFSKLSIKTPEQLWRRIVLLIVNFEHIFSVFSSGSKVG